MVKKKVGGGKRYKAVANAQAQGLSQPKWDGPAPPLHVQKKLTRKVQFLSKVSDGASKLSVNKAVSKKSGRKRALPDLSSLGEVLEEVSKRDSATTANKPKQRQHGAAVRSAKQRQHILGEESKRLQQVLQHKLYKEDPIAAITNHLRHTLPPAPPSKPAQAKFKHAKSKRT
uniref:MT0044f n=1 Tax=Volvox carteri f. nagariensis TaxID=3068 RepID=D9CIW9_VOLCA|nr:MT0044f [Volvox carteri f. nagariensis]